jgi:hypothetical protein
VSVEVKEAPPRTASKIIEDIQGGLVRAKILVRSASEPLPTPPLASIRLSVTSELETASIEIVDTITQKSIARRMDLRAVAREDRGFAAAIAAEELLRASWAELALSAARERADAAPAEVKRAVRESFYRSLPAPTPPPAAAPVRRADELALVLVPFELYGPPERRVLGLWGFEPRYARWFSESAGAEVTLIGFRRLVPVSAEHGKVSGYAVLFQAGPILRLRPTPSLRLDVAASGRLLFAHLAGEPNGTGTARDAWRPALSVQALIRPHFSLAQRGNMGAQVSVGTVLHSVRLRDEGTVVRAIEGIELGVGLYLALSL